MPAPQSSLLKVESASAIRSLPSHSSNFDDARLNSAGCFGTYNETHSEHVSLLFASSAVPVPELVWNTMRLLHRLPDSTVRVEDFQGNNIPLYAIFSHTWEKDELTFKSLASSSSSYHEKQGWRKVQSYCAQAERDCLSSQIKAWTI